MKKVNATADVSAWVDCPHCKHYFDIIEYEYKYYGESEVSDNLYENTTVSCTDMGVEVSCPECDGDFIIDNLEY